jgi:hypothetical protein
MICREEAQETQKKTGDFLPQKNTKELKQRKPGISTTDFPPDYAA